MDPQRGGSIVNVASVAALRSAANSVVYSGIKAGILGITRAAAAELARATSASTRCRPSAVPTEGTQRNRNAERDANRIARTPLGRLGTVEDIARASASWPATRRASSRRQAPGGGRRHHADQHLTSQAGRGCRRS